MSEPANDSWGRRMLPYTLTLVLISDDFFVEPLKSMRIQNPAEAIGLLLLAAAGLLVCFAMRSLHRKRVQEQRGRIEAEGALRRTSQLEALATALSKARTTADVTDACLSELLAAVGAAAGAVALVDDDGGHLNIVGALGYTDPDVAACSRVPITARTLLTEAVRSHSHLIFLSQADRGLEFPALAIDPVLAEGQGGIVLPLLIPGRAIGAVAFCFQHPHSAGSDEQEFLTGAIRRTALAFDRAQQYERAERARADAEALRERADLELRERQKAEEALRESEARYRALAARTNRLYTLSAGLSEAITLDAVAKAIVSHGKVVAGASAASVELLIDGSQFETLYAETYPPQVIEASRRFPAEPGLCATAVVETRRAVYIGSFAEWQHQYPRSASMAADGGFASAATLPLLVEGSAVGVLSFHFTVPVNFDDEYRALLTSVAQHAAQAIDRARLYETSQRARADAEAANRSKDDFLSIVSHELRTPLSAVLGWAAMLRSQMLDAARAHRAIEAIYTNATRQAHLIDDLLDVSRIVAGRAPLDLQEVDLAGNVRGAVEAIMPLAESKGVELGLGAPPADARIVADPHRLEQVFLNLLGNAVKFTPAGGRVTVHIAACEGTIDVRVTDTGRGIDRAFLPHVFERFRPADSTVLRSAGGLGLGLFIADRLVRAHGGRISAESEGEGRGAVFTVTMPTLARSSLTPRPPSAAAEAAPLGPDALPSLAGIRVLVVDDEADVRELTTSILETCGATVLSAGSTENALEALNVDGSRIDVLLADIAMPGRDGYDLIRALRMQSQSSVAGIPAAAVTACARADERQRALAAGFQMHLAKPVRPATLARAVASLAHH
jgi:signal transduction histidine kinase/CheY-like chemotaxis protein